MGLVIIENNPFWGSDVADDSEPGWYHIKARYMNFDKPNGMVIQFWVFGKSENHIRDIIVKKNYTDIEWIRQEEPPFI